ncbi:MAG TPA: hypothetical protein VFC78_03360 [Tepidisphaeraceae bacterium]|nr:hypothetical protein [Tepidisphaeraceae bacterium]
MLVTLARFEDLDEGKETQIPDFLYVIPLAAGADERALTKIFDEPEPKDDPADNGPTKESIQRRKAQSRFGTARIGNSIAVARPGVMKVLKAGISLARPDLSHALTAAGNAPVIWAAAPSDSFRKLVDKQVNDKDMAEIKAMRSIVDGVSWAAASLQLRPRSIHVIVQTKSADAATSVQQAWDQDFSPKPDPTAGVADRAEQARMIKVFNLLKPVKTGDRLTLDLNKQQIDEIAEVLLPEFFE